jgi:hypothetical protein
MVVWGDNEISIGAFQRRQGEALFGIFSVSCVSKLKAIYLRVRTSGLYLSTAGKGEFDCLKRLFQTTQTQQSTRKLLLLVKY